MAAPGDRPEAGQDPDDDARWQASLRQSGPYLGLGMQLALSVVVFTGAGVGADLYFGTMPWGTIVGAGLGMVAMFYQLLRVNAEMSQRNAAKRKPPGGNEPRPGRPEEEGRGG